MAVAVLTPGEWAYNYSGSYVVKTGNTLFYYQGGFLPWSISAPDDTTVRFEIHDRDMYFRDRNMWHNAERNELASVDNVAAILTPLTVSYGLMIEPGERNSAAWIVLGQLHQDLEDTTAVGGPVMDIGLLGERLIVYGRYTDPAGKLSVMTLYTSPTDIVRGQTYAIDIRMIADPTGTTGRLVVTLDGATVVDYQGKLGDENMKGVYWAEGIYRDAGATETLAVNYSNLSITAGDTVMLPPAITGTTAAVDAAAGGYAVTMAVTAKAGATVTILDGTQAVATALADDNGRAVLTFNATAADTHAYSAIANDSVGQLGPASGATEVVIGTAAAVAAQLAALSTDRAVGAVLLTDSQTLDIGTGADLARVVGYSALLGKIAGPVMLRTTDTITGKAYDHETKTYTATGTLVEFQRYAGDRLLLDTTYNGVFTVATNYGADGSYNIIRAKSGVTYEAEGHDAAGRLLWQQLIYGDGSKEYDYFSAASGAMTRAQVYRPDGTRVDITYGLTGKAYVKQAVLVDAAGKMVLTGRYDSADHLIFAIDAASGTTTTFQYDAASGKLASNRLALTNGSYSVSTYDAAGAIVKTGYYTAKGVLLREDQSDPASAYTSITSVVATGDSLVPSLALGAVATPAGGAPSTSLLATAKAGSVITLYEAGVAVAVGIADATGHATFKLSALPAGLHSYTAIAVDASGATALGQGADLMIGTAQSVFGQLPMLAQDSALAAIVVTDPGIVTLADNDAYLAATSYASTLAKIQQPLLLQVNAAITGKSYDREVRTYDITGAGLNLQRYAGSTQTMNTTSNGGLSVVSSLAADGSYGTSILLGGKTAFYEGVAANGNVTLKQFTFADAGRRTDTYSAADGSLARTVIYGVDGGRADTLYGIAGKAYTTQTSTYGATGAATYLGRYDAAGHLLTVTDMAVNSTTSYQYDAGGTATGYRMTRADGTYSVTSYAAGTVTTGYFTSKGKLVSEDHSDPSTAMAALNAAVIAASTHKDYANFLTGTAADDVLSAGGAASIVTGGAGDDVLVGGAGNDLLIGGKGADVMTGGAGKDVFVFSAEDFASATTVGADRITDFAQGDRIDLSGLNNSVAGHIGLSFIGTADFSGRAGEIHTVTSAGDVFVAGDLNGDRVADFMIRLDGPHSLKVTDFLL